MKIAVVKEDFRQELRVALTPEIIVKLKSLGADVHIEKNAGEHCQYSDNSYQNAGARIEPNRKKLLTTADMIVRIHPPTEQDITLMRPDTLHMSLLQPFANKTLLRKMAAQGINAFALDLVPRSTRAQKMDVLSSQSNLAGYVAVIKAAEKSGKVFPMMITPAGSISPARVLVIGAGVAGLQAIATAKRLGAQVYAFDVRPAVEEQVNSLGAKFITVPESQTKETAQGYATQTPKAQLQILQERLSSHLAQADVVITTAQAFGQRAPQIITKAMIKKMKPGSVIVDLAIESGGNVVASKAGHTIQEGNTTIISFTNMPAFVAADASNLFATNIYNLIATFWLPEKKMFNLDLEDEIIKACLLTHNKKILRKL